MSGKSRRAAERWAKAATKRRLRHGGKGETPRVDRYDVRLKAKGSR